MSGGFVRVASLEQIADGEMLLVEVAGHEVLLARLGDRVYAIGNNCTHEDVWLDDGTLHRETCEIECPMHEGRFDLRTGAATHEPCVEPVPSYPVRIDGDDVLVRVGGG
ncbi:MAG TPA: non-heme iron oxygenase ferredoxin subunit [Solirubrobacteraceae bacterium]|nr:non-heme iron oxygenase ferredoxin subunit [Solirubrobacteraceae bacterium]